MRISEYFHLGRTQPTLDFVDVDIVGDTRIFLDPRALRLLPLPWANECVSLIQNYFSKVLNLIRNSSNDEAKNLLAGLREPNETHLGLSRHEARGRALGDGSAVKVWKALRNSEAAQTGLLEDLEDTILMIEGVSSDIISDMATNIIREPLIHYTQDMATYYGIPLITNVSSGPLWNPNTESWYTTFVQLPITSSGKILFVPKAIVRTHMDYDAGEYYRDYILEHLREQELAANTALVHLLRDGRRRVTDKALKQKYGTGKSVIVRQTQANPELLQRYRRDRNLSPLPPLNHIEISERIDTPDPDWDTLLTNLINVPAGRDDSTEYENAVESILSALFYPSLMYPQKQTPIHDGRKRIDITYTNGATDGFFHWVGQHHPASHIFVECKNYSRDPANPELDQLSGRFSLNRGQVGILVARSFTDKGLFLQRCKDTAQDQRGFIIALDDQDIRILVDERKYAPRKTIFALLRERFNQLVM
jgi:hypothetical protein